MTLVTAWIRNVGANDELVIASDSRITGGIAMNHAPKLLRLERNDSVLAYCGPTLLAYPILLQIKATLDAHDETRDRVIDIVDLKAHIEKTIERLRAKIDDLPSKDNAHRSFKFLLAGYSWKYSVFRAWVFRYDLKTQEFNAFSMPKGKNKFIFMSDVSENEILAKNILLENIHREQGNQNFKLDWEPLKVLLSFIKDESIDDIGGPPQIIKVYKHANTLPINVLWPDDRIENSNPIRTFEINHLGRPLLGYERTRLLTLDLKTWEMVEPWNIRERANHYNELEIGKLRTRLLTKIVNHIAWKRNNLQLQANLTEMVKAGCTLEELQTAMASSKKA